MSIKSPKVEFEFEIDPSEVTNKGLQRMLRTAMSQMRQLSKPLHQREEVAEDDVDDETNEADKERMKTADLHAARGEPAPIPATDEDFRESVSDKLPKKIPGKGKKA
jgi:hypothetical protein